MQPLFENLIFLGAGALLALCIDMGKRNHERRNTKKLLIKIIREDINLIDSEIRETKADVEELLKMVRNPKDYLDVTKCFAFRYSIQELGQELFLLDEPLPKLVLQTRLSLEKFNHLYMGLVQVCNDLTRGCSSFEDRKEKLKENWCRNILKEQVLEIKKELNEISKNVKHLRMNL